MPTASSLRVGNIIKHNNDICRVVSIAHITPGKGRAMIHTKMVSVLKGNNVEFRFRPNEKYESVRLEENEVEYLYFDGSNHIFMDLETFEQIPLAEEFVGDNIKYILPSAHCFVETLEGNPIGIKPPSQVVLTITETEPKFKGATAASSYKPATLETGVIIQVPPFVETGDAVRIDTSNKKYLERVKK